MKYLALILALVASPAFAWTEIINETNHNDSFSSWTQYDHSAQQVQDCFRTGTVVNCY